MLEAKQIVTLRYCLTLSTAILPWYPEKKSLDDLAYLLHPEDTTDDGQQVEQELDIPMENRTPGIIKTILWFTAAIAFSLMLSQLH